MRKLVSLGLLALILSFLSSQVVASNAEACDVLKKAKRGLHGLCVAWHNANEKNKGKIADKFLARAGYPITDIVGGGPDPVDPDPVECPCWTPTILANAVAGFDGGFCFSNSSYEAAIYAGNLPAVWAGTTPFVDTSENAFATECRLLFSDGSTAFVFETDMEQDEVCRDDVRTLQTATNDLEEPLFPPCF